MDIKKIIKNLLYSITIILISLLILNLFAYSKTHSKQSVKPKPNTDNAKYYPFKLPAKVDFAGEHVPIEYFDVRESLDKEILKIAYWHSELFLYLKRANRVFPVVEPILKKYGIPDDFKYLLVAESGLVNISSPAGAEGYWQLMKKTAREYGLEVNDEVDERYHLEKSTIAACKYLKRRYKKYKSWAMVAASYNAGDAGISRYTNYQKVNSYYDLAMFEETARYVYRAIAFKIIMSKPEQYGFMIEKKDLYPIIPYQKVKVDTAITDMISFAKKYNTNYKIFKILNPWLRAHKLSNKNKKTYIIKMPKNGARKTQIQ
ncbi:MAG: lytic transglycosylase domain-containing protein [Bacteroidales bacterium]|nr:lytic transglycosylase domain-containing protein [Bacteroidales bacterium]